MPKDPPFKTRLKSIMANAHLLAAWQTMVEAIRHMARTQSETTETANERSSVEKGKQVDHHLEHLLVHRMEPFLCLPFIVSFGREKRARADCVARVWQAVGCAPKLDEESEEGATS